MALQNMIKFTAKKCVFHCLEQAKSNAAIRLEVDKKDNWSDQWSERIRIILLIWMYFMNKCTLWVINREDT